MPGPQEVLNRMCCVCSQNPFWSYSFDECFWHISGQVFWGWCLISYCGKRRVASLAIDTSHLKAVVVKLFVPRNSPGPLDMSCRLGRPSQLRGRLIRSKPAKQSLRMQGRGGCVSGPHAVLIIVVQRIPHRTLTHLAGIGRLMTKGDSFESTELPVMSASCNVSPRSALQRAQRLTHAAFRGRCDLSPGDTLN